MEEKPGVLTPAQRRALQQGLADCASCGAKLDYLRQIGAPNDELEQRKEHTASVIQAMLEIDSQQRKG